MLYNANKPIPCCSGASGTPPGVSSKDVQPNVPPPPYPVQIQVPPGQFQPLIYDRGLMEAVTNAQNFVAQTFPGARLLESHNVSSQQQQLYIAHFQKVWQTGERIGSRSIMGSFGGALARAKTFSLTQVSFNTEQKFKYCMTLKRMKMRKQKG